MNIPADKMGTKTGGGPRSFDTENLISGREKLWRVCCNVN
jgi:hypothetical protein